MTYSLVGMTAAFGGGILLARLLPAGIGPVVLFGLAAGVAVGSFLLSRVCRPFLVGLLLSVALLGVLRARTAEPALEALYRRAPHLEEVTGTVVSYPDLEEGRTAFLLAPDEIPARLRVTVFWNKGAREAIHYGDRLRLGGSVEVPARGPDFDYRAYLARQGVFALMDVDGSEGIERVGVGGSRLLRLGDHLRQRLLERLDRALPAGVAGLGHGLLFGERANLSPKIEEAFRRTGLTHLLAISGMNLAIFLAGLWFLLRLVGLRPAIAYPLVGVAVLAILWLVGLPVSLARAAAMFGFLALGSVLADLGILLRRSVSVTQGLAAAALAILAVRPAALFDIGFQLSFGATAAIAAAFSPSLGLEEGMEALAARSFLPTRLLRYVLTLVLVSLAAQAGTAPFLAWHFGTLYPLGLFANLLVVPLATLAQWTGVIALFASATPLFPTAARAFGGLLEATITCVDHLSRLPFTCLAVPGWMGVWIGGLALYVFVVSFYLGKEGVGGLRPR